MLLIISLNLRNKNYRSFVLIGVEINDIRSAYVCYTSL